MRGANRVNRKELWSLRKVMGCSESEDVTVVCERAGHVKRFDCSFEELDLNARFVCFEEGRRTWVR